MVGLLLAAVSVAWAARVSLLADTDSLAVGQTMTVVVRVEDGSPTSLPQVEVPDGLRLSYSGQQTRSGWEIDLAGKRRARREVGYQFELTAVREGRYTLGPARIELGTAQMETGTVPVRVNAPPPASEAAARAAAGFNATEVWEGQVVLYSYELAYRARVVRSQWSLPDLHGLVAPRDGDRPRQVYTLDSAGGAEVIDRTWVPLLATQAGTFEFDPAIVHIEVATGESAAPPARFDPFGVFQAMERTRAEALATAPARLTVQRLPAAPPGFHGLVGDFSARELRNPGGGEIQVPVGRSIEFVVEVAGNGSIEGLALAAPPETDGLRVYDSVGRSDATVTDGAYHAVVRLPRVVVPTREGRFPLPPVEIVAFSPSTGAYVTHRVELGTVVGIPGEASRADVASFASPPDRVEATPLDDIRVAAGTGGGAQRARIGALWPVAGLVAGLPGVALVAAAGLGAIRARRAAQPPARPDPQVRLGNLPEDRPSRLAALDMAIREALALRVGVEVSALDRAVAAHDLPEALRDEVLAVTQSLDRARFAGAEATGLAERVAALVGALVRP